jgi:hypothetical protein
LVQPQIKESFQQALSEWTELEQTAWPGAVLLDETLQIGEQAFMSTGLVFGLPQQQQPPLFMEMGLQEDLISSEFPMDGIFFEQGFDQQDFSRLGTEMQLCL